MVEEKNDNAMTPDVARRQAEEYRSKGTRMLEIADEFESIAALLNGQAINRPGAKTTEGRSRISEANKSLWQICPRPSCKGKKHRARGKGMHPHFRHSSMAHR